MAILPACVEETVRGLKQRGDSWIGLCPAHDDTHPSLSLTINGDGKLLARCHAGCDQRAVLDAIGYQPERADKPEWTPHGEAVAVYDYRDEAGNLLFQVLRTADKQFPQRRPDPAKKTGWTWSLGDTRRVLYRLPELVRAVEDGRSVCIAEGEKDVHALLDHGRVATCNPGGAGKWRDTYDAHFIDATVTIFADKDRPGREHARRVAAALDGVAAKVWIVEAADPHKDIAAHLGAGLTLTDVVVTHRSDDPVKPDLALDMVDLLASKEPDYDWLVEGLIERRDRFILTGFEGLGKTMALRQLAACFAVGLHPFKFTDIDPLRVLWIDAENTERQNRRKFRGIFQSATRARHPLARGQFHLELVPDGKDLPAEDGQDAAWLTERVTAHRPDVVFIGPLYNLHLDSPNDERVIRRLVAAINTARNKVDCAMFLEAHAGHGNADSKSRSVRPTGSSLYLRWPEFGYGLRPVVGKDGEPVEGEVQLVPWRGARDERDWPRRLRRSDEWPWVPVEDGFGSA